MKTYWKSEAEDATYYIKYSIDGYTGQTIHEFWTDEEELYKGKLGFILRHIGSYRLIESRPLTNEE